MELKHDSLNGADYNLPAIFDNNGTGSLIERP